MSDYQERIKKYMEKLYDNYEIVNELSKSKSPSHKRVARILCDPKDYQELRIAEAHLNIVIATKNIRWAIDNGVYEPKSIDSNDTLKLIIDYSINSTKSISERRSLNSFIEERFGTITPEISAKIWFHQSTTPKDKKSKEYAKMVIKDQDIKMTNLKIFKYFLSLSSSEIKMLSFIPSVFELKKTEQDISNYERFSRAVVNLCEEEIKANIKDYWNFRLSKLNPEDSFRIYNSISEANKEALAEMDSEEIKWKMITNAFIFALSNLKYNLKSDIALKDINRIAEESSVSSEKLINLIIYGVFSRKPIVEAWFILEGLKNSYEQGTNEYPSYIARYLEEAIRESEVNKEEQLEIPKEYTKK